MSGEMWEARKAQSPCVGLSSHSSLASHGTGGEAHHGTEAASGPKTHVAMRGACCKVP